MNFIVTVSGNKEATDLGNAARKKFYKIESGFICPMNIFKYNEHDLFMVSKFLQQAGKQGCALGNMPAFMHQLTVHLGGNII